MWRTGGLGTAAATAILLLLSATAAGGTAADSRRPCEGRGAECVGQEQPSPPETASSSYQEPRPLRKVVRTTLLAANASEPPPETEAAPSSSSPRTGRPGGRGRELIELAQLTPVFGRRLSAMRNRTAAVTPAAGPGSARRLQSGSEAGPPRETAARPNALPRRRRPSSRRRYRRPPAAAAAADDDLSERANALEEATRHGSDGGDERAFRVERLKRRRKILAKKLVRKQFLGDGPRKKIVKVVAVRKPPRVIPGLTEVYQDNLVNSLISEEYPSLQPAPGIKGFPGVDYPIYQRIPETSFSCSHQRYWGMYADTETQCQVWHYCDQDGTKHSFLCPNGTIFSQVTFICDWWFNVDCNTALQLYVTNEALSLLPAPPEKTFPEDFNGPIVDWYIYQRHQERAYRKEKFLRQLEAGQRQEAIRFLETHDFPPWFTPRDQALYRKLKALERKSKHHEPPPHRPVKKELTQYAPRYARTAV
ncbi:uncharacterized protein LOC122388666 [Amphibalanus amphitrite]|uniref:uncharacterized protein LOC122388666 n=1 Tax=Amphibalanus amphitrite TaxID=1232801 RepID=UPI001C928735|nr:uncharacterized protein LOC122388666 [Amphibalanus amphitrite]